MHDSIDEVIYHSCDAVDTAEPLIEAGHTSVAINSS